MSNRRRHTRYWRDWSSDVCSSDLGQTTASYAPAFEEAAVETPHAAGVDGAALIELDQVEGTAGRRMHDIKEDVVTVGRGPESSIFLDDVTVSRKHAEIERRSEEHTSELQSRQYLVCRLLLEKKKTHR